MKYFSQPRQVFLPKSFHTLSNNNMKTSHEEYLDESPVSRVYRSSSLADLAVSFHENNTVTARVIVIAITPHY